MSGEATGWAARLKSGLSKSSRALSGAINDIFVKRPLDAAALQELEDALISADLGVEAAGQLAQSIAKTPFDKVPDAAQVRTVLAGKIAEILAPVAVPFDPDVSPKPHVVLVCGVNGSGKTTTIGKLAHHYREAGLSVLLAAADTFRAAATQQLNIWGQRSGCEVVAGEPGADAAGLAFEALQRARADGTDLLFIDTAGRLQNRTELMDELKKTVRVLGKLDQQAPHSVLLILDATTGQNAHAQVEIFKQMVDVSGLIVTKLDGSSKGGVLVALAEKFELPVHAVGVGEQIQDLRPFAAADFARSLLDV
ncbi:MAG: signal recognition particle-docking protein FtsY [Rhodospirillales bacterium]|jgi:fused signal recognition particle receptor|nr:signal recognition particle-docking protein FtsY [Rhodospirillaceae bacterium]MDP6428839.1 signal recognition particle-docking protein FtsY [Rhodospirillales bacterium]MDP6643970.1 signal recognition particle-docking protein FtsY [Rhodospirillales bacterium]MDP6841097.1 signal recognition particle-docking protein FtsY [Rhodospirillales bacterium]